MKYRSEPTPYVTAHFGVVEPAHLRQLIVGHGFAIDADATPANIHDNLGEMGSHIAGATIAGKLIWLGDMTDLERTRSIVEANGAAFLAGEIPEPFGDGYVIGFNAMEGTGSRPQTHVLYRCPGDDNTDVILGAVATEIPSVGWKLMPTYLLCGLEGVWHLSFDIMTTKENIGAPERELAEAVARSYGVMTYTASLMASPDVRRDVLGVPEKTNKSRLRSGKPAIQPSIMLDGRSYVTRPTTVGEKQPHQGGTHASPVPHKRRAHTRTYKSGKVAQIGALVVNAHKGQPVARSHYDAAPKKPRPQRFEQLAFPWATQ